jgi:hypothetical protein
MKKSLLAIATLILLGSCSSESTSEKSSEDNLLIANWTYSHKYQNDNYYGPSLCNDNDQLEFRSNQRWQADYYTKDDNGNCYNDEEEFGTWEKEGDELTLFYEDMGDEADPDIFKIQKLTKSELELKLEFEGGNYHIYAYKR